MNEPVPMTVQCHGTEDETGDLIVELPTTVLNAMGVTLDDLLRIELIDGETVNRYARLTRARAQS
ncbi:hypothetical protein K814_0116645 [Pseudomonas fluorescens LMG 5329]|uniref:AbrB family transcriptional regulator n=1 Tax=Pseudomonas fluorescens LMG 5329 TaxID=1324332 RepID=A0A0A1YXZ7_PSEFL|nr:hypothetical protein K814_0116645 [Pseudomonas fluorescens LMG 5329]